MYNTQKAGRARGKREAWERDKVTDREQKLIKSLKQARADFYNGYWTTRDFIDKNVPNWVRGDDGPSYPLLRAALKINQTLIKLGINT